MSSGGGGWIWAVDGESELVVVPLRLVDLVGTESGERPEKRCSRCSS